MNPVEVDENMDEVDVVVISDDDDVEVLPPDYEEEEEDQLPVVVDNVIPSCKKYTLLETRLHPSTNLTDSPLNSVTFEDCSSLAEFYENCKNRKEYPLSGIGSSITLAPKRVAADNDNTDTTTKRHGNVTKFWYLSLRLVTKYGHHITSLEVKIRNGVEFPTMFWTVLSKILRFLPNLRSLFIEASFRQFSQPNCGANMLLPQLESIDAIKCPSSLTKLSFLGVRFTEINVLTKLMTLKLLEAYGSQLKKLSVTHVTFDMIDKGNLQKLRNLVEFNLFWWRSGGGGGGNNQENETAEQSDLQCMQGLRTSILFKLEGMGSPGLEKLRVMLNNTGFATVKHPSYLFKLLEKFPKLKVLNLSGMQLDTEHRWGMGLSCMKKWRELEGNETLECLKFRDKRGVSHDFLEKLEGLEALFIEGATEYPKMNQRKPNGAKEEVEDKRVIKLQEYLYGERQLFKSNIWEKVPKLRMIGVQCQVAPGGELGGDGDVAAGGGGAVEETEEIFTREMYEMEEWVEGNLY